MEKDLKLINDLTGDIRKVYKIETPIMDMREIVERIGGSVVSVLHEPGLYRTGKSFLIAISPYKEDLNYEIAYHLGHLFMHMFYEVDEDLWNNQPVNKAYISKDVRQEFRANKFALALMMPYNELREVLLKNYQNGTVDIEKVAKHFGVTTAQVIRRGEQVRFFKDPVYDD